MSFRAPVSVHVEVQLSSSEYVQSQKDFCVWAMLHNGAVIAGDYKDTPGTASSAHVKLLRDHGVTVHDIAAAGSLKEGVVRPNSCLNKIKENPTERMAVDRFIHRTSPGDFTKLGAAAARKYENDLGKHPCDISYCIDAAYYLSDNDYTVRKDEDGEYMIDMSIE